MASSTEDSAMKATWATKSWARQAPKDISSDKPQSTARALGTVDVARIKSAVARSPRNWYMGARRALSVANSPSRRAFSTKAAMYSRHMGTESQACRAWPVRTIYQFYRDFSAIGVRIKG
jgi:hypothetical protein